MEVFDVTGRKVFETNFKEEEFLLKKQDVGNGIFVVTVTHDNSRIIRHKILFTN